MAALGRQFKLGGLYDYLNDKVMKGNSYFLLVIVVSPLFNFLN